MPHIHTEPGQHDITTSAWIFKEDKDELRALVHMHRKHGKLMQVGGHIEIDETPWQTLAHEIPEESGFALSELQILQPQEAIIAIPGATVHPLPVISNTHFVGNEHYHSDYGYAFVAAGEPKSRPADGESTDLRWMTIAELRKAALAGIALNDIVAIYDHIASTIVPNYFRLDATRFATDKPSESMLSGEQAKPLISQ